MAKCLTGKKSKKNEMDVYARQRNDVVSAFRVREAQLREGGPGSGRRPGVATRLQRDPQYQGAILSPHGGAAPAKIMKFAGTKKFVDKVTAAVTRKGQARLTAANVWANNQKVNLKTLRKDKVLKARMSGPYNKPAVKD